MPIELCDSNGTCELSALNNNNASLGITLLGEAADDNSGYSVSSAGDINDDGITDFLIGAYGASPGGISGAGKTYIVFGSRNLTAWGNGTLALKTLSNGQQGFSLNGEAAGDQSGFSVSSAGDINGDGITDILIGARYASPGGLTQAGKTYIVFGSRNLTAWENGNLTLSNLINGRQGFSLSGEAASDKSGVSVSSAGDINGDGITDILIGAYRASPGGLTDAGKTYIVFGSRNLTAWENGNLTLSNLINGRQGFSLSGEAASDKSGVSVSSAGDINGDGITDILIGAYQPGRNDTGKTYLVWGALSTSAAPTSAAPTSAAPTPGLRLARNQLSLSNGQSLILSLNDLQAIKTGVNDNRLVFSISGLEQGSFVLLPGNKTTYSFTQQHIQDALVQFIHPGNQQAPLYWTSVSDGSQSTIPAPAAINFFGAPIITQQVLNMTQGGNLTLTPSNLNITVTDGTTPEQVIIQVLDTQHAQIISNTTGAALSNFSLADLQAGTVIVLQDGSSSTPSYTVSASGITGITSTPSTSDLRFSSQGILAPRLANHFLSISQGLSRTLTPNNFQVSQGDGSPLPTTAVYYINTANHIRFSLKDKPSTEINFFTQADLDNASVILTQDGSRQMPSYSASVSLFGLKSVTQPALVSFNLVNQAPELNLDILLSQSAVVGSSFSYVVPTNTFTDPENEALTLSTGRYNSSAPLPTWLSFNPSNNRYSGIPDAPGFLDINLTARDPEGLMRSTNFALTISPALPINTSSYLTRTIVGSVLSGLIGLGFLLLKVILQKAANKKLSQALGDGTDAYDLEVVRPVAKEVARRVKVTGFMNHTTNKEMVNFKGSVRTILAELDYCGVDVQLSKMEAVKRDALINDIATQTQSTLLPKQGPCDALTSFFKAQATPKQIRDAAPTIAGNVVKALNHRSKSSQALGGTAMAALSTQPSTLKAMSQRESAGHG